MCIWEPSCSSFLFVGEPSTNIVCLQDEIARWKEKYAAVANDLLPRAQSATAFAQEDAEAARKEAMHSKEVTATTQQQAEQMRLQFDQVRRPTHFSVLGLHRFCHDFGCCLLCHCAQYCSKCLHRSLSEEAGPLLCGNLAEILVYQDSHCENAAKQRCPVTAEGEATEEGGEHAARGPGQDDPARQRGRGRPDQPAAARAGPSEGGQREGRAVPRQVQGALRCQDPGRPLRNRCAPCLSRTVTTLPAAVERLRRTPGLSSRPVCTVGKISPQRTQARSLGAS